MIEKMHLQVLLKSMACVDKRLTSIPAATVQLHDPSYKHVYSPQVWNQNTLQNTLVLIL